MECLWLLLLLALTMWLQHSCQLLRVLLRLLQEYIFPTLLPLQRRCQPCLVLCLAGCLSLHLEVWHHPQ